MRVSWRLIEHDGQGLIVIGTLREGRRNMSRFLVVQMLNAQIRICNTKRGQSESVKDA